MTSSERSRALKERLAEGVSRLWLVGFALAGRLNRAGTVRWSPVGGGRVLVLAPHPDDETLGCAGTLLRHYRAGDAVCLVFATDGRCSRALGLGPEEMARQRRQEALVAAESLGIAETRWLGLPEGQWTPAELAEQLQAILLDFRPQIIYAPSLVDFHPEHQQVALALATALTRDSTLVVRVYAVQVPLTAILANLVSDVTQVAGQSRAAFAAYATQQASLRCGWRARRYAARYYRCGTYAELFWQMSAAAYCRVHRQAPPFAFRGLRPRPWADPLAYLAGRRARRLLRARAAYAREIG